MASNRDEAKEHDWEKDFRETVEKIKATNPSFAMSIIRFHAHHPELEDTLNNAGYGWEALAAIPLDPQNEINAILEGIRGDVESWVIKDKMQKVAEIVQRN